MIKLNSISIKIVTREFDLLVDRLNKWKENLYGLERGFDLNPSLDKNPHL